MIETFLQDEKIKKFLNQWEIEQETLILEKIQLGDREMYPVYQIEVLYNKSGKIASASLNPVLCLVLENKERYIILFDEKEIDNYEDLFDLFDLIPQIENNNDPV